MKIIFYCPLLQKVFSGTFDTDLREIRIKKFVGPEDTRHKWKKI